jgi:hypothetical protein
MTVAFAGFTDVGFPNTMVTGADWHDVQKAFGTHDAFMGHTHLKPEIVAGGTRRVRLLAGESVGSGVWSKSDATINVDLPSQSSGSKWHLIATERVWGGTPEATGTRIVQIPGTTNATPTIPALTRNKGNTWQTPVALARVQSGQTAPTALIDLRVIRSLGGAYTVYSDMALDTIQVPGVTAYNAATKRYYVSAYANTGGTLDWIPLLTEEQANSYEELSGASQFGQSESGWNSGSSVYQSILVRDQKRRFMSLSHSRIGPAITPIAGSGNVANMNIFRLLASSDRPKVQVPGTLRYQTSGGADLAGLATLWPDGYVQINSIVPATDIRGGGSGGWSTVFTASWYVA